MSRIRSPLLSLQSCRAILYLYFVHVLVASLPCCAGEDPTAAYFPPDVVYKPSICLSPSNDPVAPACSTSWRTASQQAVVVDVRMPTLASVPPPVTPVKNFTTLLGLFGLPFTYGSQTSGAVAATLSRYAAPLHIGNRAALIFDRMARWDAPPYAQQLDVSICVGNFSMQSAGASEYFIDPDDGVFVWTIRSAPLADCSAADLETSQCNLTAQVQVDSGGDFSIIYREVPRQFASIWMSIGLGPSTWGDIFVNYTRLLQTDTTSTTPAPSAASPAPNPAPPPVAELLVSWTVKKELWQCLQFTTCKSCPSQQDCVWAASFGGARGQCVTNEFAGKLSSQLMSTMSCGEILPGLCRRSYPMVSVGFCSAIVEVDPVLNDALLRNTIRSNDDENNEEASFIIPAGVNNTQRISGIVPVDGNAQLNLSPGPVTAELRYLPSSARRTLQLTDAYGNVLGWAGVPVSHAATYRQTRVTHRYCSAPYAQTNESCMLYSWSFLIPDSSEDSNHSFATWSLVYFGRSGVTGIVGSNTSRLLPSFAFPMVTTFSSGKSPLPPTVLLVGGPMAAVLLVAYSCLTPCYFGTCGENGECLCYALWQGNYCNIPRNSYLIVDGIAQNASDVANESNNVTTQRVDCPVCGPYGHCDVLSGTCRCAASHTGPRCEYLCDPHKYDPSAACSSGNSSSTGTSLHAVSLCTRCTCFVGWANSSGGVCDSVAPSCNMTATGVLLGNVRACSMSSHVPVPRGSKTPPTPGRPRFPDELLDANEPQWTKTTTLAIALVLTIFGFLTSLALQQVRLRSSESEDGRSESATSASTPNSVSHVVRLVLPPPRPLVNQDEQALCRRR